MSLIIVLKFFHYIALFLAGGLGVANSLLAKNKGIIASFSRALTEGLSAKQSDDQFDALLDSTIQSIYNASVKKS